MGHRDKEKDYLRVDAPSVSFDIFRLILSLCAALGQVVGQMDVKSAFLQDREFYRLFYVRTPREAATNGLLRRLYASAYGLADRGCYGI